MEPKTKDVTLSPKKCGAGTVTSYSVNIGPKEARTCGFMNESGEPYKLKKIIDEENQQIILKAIK